MSVERAGEGGTGNGVNTPMRSNNVHGWMLAVCMDSEIDGTVNQSGNFSHSCICINCRSLGLVAAHITE